MRAEVGQLAQSEGPAWYATPTVAYAVELGYAVRPLEAYVRYDNGRYLDTWYPRLRDAYLATMADLGVDADLPPEDFLTAMSDYRTRDPELAIVVSAVKATVKGGLGKLRERPRGEGWRPGEPWRALSRPTWRPDIRAAVISRVTAGRPPPRASCGAGKYATGMTPRNSTSPGTSRTAPSPTSTTESRSGRR